MWDEWVKGKEKSGGVFVIRCSRARRHEESRGVPSRLGGGRGRQDTEAVPSLRLCCEDHYIDRLALGYLCSLVCVSVWSGSVCLDFV
jgi:hypothetical protein